MSKVGNDLQSLQNLLSQNFPYDSDVVNDVSSIYSYYRGPPTHNALSKRSFRKYAAKINVLAVMIRTSFNEPVNSGIYRTVFKVLEHATQLSNPTLSPVV